MMIGRRALLGAATLGAVVLFVGAFLLVRWQHDRAPYALPETSPTVTGLQVIAADDLRAGNVAAALDGLGGVDEPDSLAPPRAPGQQYVVGRVHLAARTGAPDGSQYALTVSDDRSHVISTALWSVTSNVGAGWDYGLDRVAADHPSLIPLRDGTPQSVDGAPQALLWAAGPETDLTFFAQLEPDALPADAGDVTVALVFLGPDRQSWGAQRLR